jgi:hypothetical protein
MLRCRVWLCGLALSVLPGACLTAAARTAGPPGVQGPRVTLAVADFRGADGETGRFLAEMLMNALDQSAGFRLVECGEVRRAGSELKLDAAHRLAPEQVRRLGERVSADYLVLGSYLESDQHIVLTARLLDVASGRPEPGCAGSMEGSRRELVALAGGLARQLHERAPEYAPRRESDVAPAARETAADVAPEDERLEEVVSEGELAAMVRRLARERGLGRGPFLTVQRPDAPVTRLRALAALVKLLVAPEELAASVAAAPEEMPPDAAQVPAWGVSYVAAAVVEGLIAPDEPLRARETATWAFVRELVARLPSRDAPRPGGPYTGIIVDARGFDIQRGMGPRLMDEDGNVFYPDPRRVPSADALQEAGMVGYATDAREARRAGARPLIVRALDVTGPAQEDVVVSREAAERILAADRRWRCLSRRAVSILVPLR